MHWRGSKKTDLLQKERERDRTDSQWFCSNKGRARGKNGPIWAKTLTACLTLRKCRASFTPSKQKSPEIYPSSLSPLRAQIPISTFLLPAVAKMSSSSFFTTSSLALLSLSLLDAQAVVVLHRHTGTRLSLSDNLAQEEVLNLLPNFLACTPPPYRRTPRSSSHEREKTSHTEQRLLLLGDS